MNSVSLSDLLKIQISIPVNCGKEIKDEMTIWDSHLLILNQDGNFNDYDPDDENKSTAECELNKAVQQNGETKMVSNYCLEYLIYVDMRKKGMTMKLLKCFRS